MALDRTHYIHSRGGALGAQGLSSAADVDAIVAQLGQAPNRHLILHFHGGLVSAKAGFELAERLLPVYSAAGHPVFFIWESGAWETIRNNLLELADEPLFRQLLRKALEYALGRLGARSGARSITPQQVDASEVARTLDRFIADPQPDNVPYKDFEPASPDGARARDEIDAAEIEADLEQDQEFKRALASLPDLPSGRRSAWAPLGAAAAPRQTPFALIASEKLSERPDRRGLVTLFKAGLLLKDIVVGVIKRHRAKRDHGFYATVVEEIVRAFKIGGSGLNEWGKALQWSRMKKDCVDAFGEDPALHAGSALLARLGVALNQGLKVDRITLIGHSTGAIYICEWLAAAAQRLAGSVQFDVVLLAPAVSYARYAAMLAAQGDRIRNFRMFSMNDRLEREDQVWGADGLAGAQDWRRFVYPSSLLYLVSGILESRAGVGGALIDEPDMPLLGMERFFTSEAVYTAADFPEVAQVRAWLAGDAKRTVWSVKADAGPGLNSSCNDHGAFDNEPDTLASLGRILGQGF
jgi:pimeloyl-ACP methyl ester carboxylesterase